MSITGAKAASFFDNGDTAGSPTEGTVVQLNNIAQNSELFINGQAEEDWLGNEQYAGDEAFLDIAFYDTAGVDQLISWMKSRTLLQFVLAGLQQNVLWYEPRTIKVVKPFGFATKKRNFTKVQMRASGGPVKVWTGINLLHGAVILDGFASGWQDSNADNLADGFALLSGTAVSFLSGIQTVNGSGIPLITKNIHYPISQLSLTISNTAETLHPQDNEFSMKVIFKDHSDVQLSEFTAVTSVTGRLSKSGSSPAGAYTIENKIIWPAGTTTAGDIASSFPALRTDGSDEYIAG